MPFSDDYWSKRYKEGNTGWDIGSPSRPIIDYTAQLHNKKIDILIPGCGNAYEAEVLLAQGFQNIHLLDISAELINRLKSKFKNELDSRIYVHHGDFLEFSGQFDLILEQTMFCALKPKERPSYVKKAYNLLRDKGRLAGLLFNFPLTEEGPPFGGSENEYRELFSPCFKVEKLEIAYNSIKPRAGKEFFIKLQKRLS